MFKFPFRSLSQNERRRQIAENLIWAVTGKIVTLMGSLLVGIIVARYLGPERYGLMNYVISYVFLFQTFAVFGLDNIEVREESKRPEDTHKIMGTALLIRYTLAFVTLSAIAATTWAFEADRYTTLLIAIYSSSLLVTPFNIIRNNFLARVQNKYVVKSEITRTLFGMAIKFSLLWMGCGLTWFVVASTFDWVLLASGYIMSYHHKVGRIRDWQFDLQEARFLIKESFPLLLTSAAVIVYQRIDQVMIDNFIGHESVGYFSVASRMVEVLIYIPMMLAQTISPVLTSIRTTDETEYRKKAQLFMNVSVWTSGVMAAIVSLLAYKIVMLLFGEQYLPAVIVLQVMSFKAMSVALSNTAGAMLVIEGLQRYAIFRDLLGCFVCISLNYLLLPHYGIVAAAGIAILSNVAAGYIADAFIPAYRHLFRHQTKALLFGWKDILKIPSLLK